MLVKIVREFFGTTLEGRSRRMCGKTCWRTHDNLLKIYILLQFMCKSKYHCWSYITTIDGCLLWNYYAIKFLLCNEPTYYYNLYHINDFLLLKTCWINMYKHQYTNNFANIFFFLFSPPWCILISNSYIVRSFLLIHLGYIKGCDFHKSLAHKFLFALIQKARYHGHNA